MRSISSEKIAVIAGAHLNAYGIYEALRACGWSGRIAVIRGADEKFIFGGLFRDVETWVARFEKPEDILALLGEKLGANSRPYIFLTDEQFHQALIDAKLQHVLANAVYHVGSEKYLQTILDRQAFCKFINDRKLAETPITLDCGRDPWAFFGRPFIFRFRYSWDGVKGLDRVRMVTSRQELDGLVHEYRQQGFHDESWCYQEALSAAPEDNVSVCGWHDEHEQLYCVTRTLLRYPPLRGTALVCEKISGHENLKAQTKAILSAFEYRGPFEMEFVRDPSSGRFKVIELNPRFWLQHSLAQQATGYQLMLKYMGVGGHISQPFGRKQYWINTAHVLARLCLGELSLARYFCKIDTLRMPGVFKALCILAAECRYKLRRTLKSGAVL